MTLLTLLMGFAFILTVLSTGSCTKKIEQSKAAEGENLTVIIGSVSADGDTTVYLQTVVRPK